MGLRAMMGLFLAVAVLAMPWTGSASESVGDSVPVIQAELVAPPGVPAPPNRTEPALVKVSLETVERKGRLADGAEFVFWTFGGTVPGPMIRVREGDWVELTLKNAHDSHFPHSIDLHGVTGPGGGAKFTQIGPGQDAAFRFKALQPGVYVYHCATPMIPLHVANGMYGLMVVEPADGFPKVDREFYVMQGDIYTNTPLGSEGLQEFSVPKLLAETPDYIVFNGAVGSLSGERALQAQVGERIRIFFGVGGPNVTSSFHMIGEIFDTVYPEASTSAPRQNVQTTMVPAGGAAVVEFQVEVPGTYMFVDHSLSRIHKGALGMLKVIGPENPEVFLPLRVPSHDTGGH